MTIESDVAIKYAADIAYVSKKLKQRVYMKLTRTPEMRKQLGHKKPGKFPQLCFNVTEIFRASDKNCKYDFSKSPLRGKIILTLAVQDRMPISSAELAKKFKSTSKTIQNAMLAINNGTKLSNGLNLSEKLIIGNSKKGGYVFNSVYSVIPRV